MKAVITMALCATITVSLAQRSTDQEEMLDKLADELLSTADADISYEELYETLTHLLANPIDINMVTREQLRAVMILSEEEINALLDYRAMHSPLLSILELQAIPQWSPATLKRVIPFVTVPDPNNAVNKDLLKRLGRENNNYLVMRYERTLESRKGYTSQVDSAQRYAGNPDKYYTRFRISRPNDFSLGFTAEKDPGETLAWNPAVQQYGFDFYSGHLQLMKKGRLENLVFGDFQCQFGQGLQLGSVFGLGKSSQTITGTRRSNLGFMPYMSAGESFYMRGAAVTLRLAAPLRIHLFGSYKNRDASIHQEEERIASMLNSGLHRTPREMATRNQITDRDLGLVVQIRNSRFDVGIIAHEKKLSRPLSPEPSPYNQFRFDGTSYLNVGAYLNFSWANVTFFSEAARTLGRGGAVTAGVLGNLTSKLEMAWLYRYFSADYFAEYANAFSESSTPQNETGIYWGGRYTFNRRVALSGYLDVFRFPWLRYRIYQPSDGTEWLLRLSYAPTRSIAFFVQVREEVKARNLSGETTRYEVMPGTRRNVWTSCEFAATPAVTLRTRLQASQYELGESSTRGMAVVQEVTLKKNRWSLSVRYALFDTEDYENRQYVYEKDVWLATSLPAYEGSGLRNYVLAHYAVSRQVDVWLRWSRTWYSDREFVGSGTEEITGNARNDVKFQVRIRI